MGLLFPQNPAVRRRRDQALFVLFAALLVLLVVRAVEKGRRARARDEARGGAPAWDASHGVLARNREFGARFLARQDPWLDPMFDADRERRKLGLPPRGGEVHGPYPPSLALAAAPLALLPEAWARFLWACLQAGALAFLWLLCRRWTRRLWPELLPAAPLLYAGALLLASHYLLRDTAGGGGNLILATLTVAGLELVLAGREGLAGPVLGLGLALKPALAPVLLFLAARGRWRALGSTAAAWALLFLLPGFYYGMAEYLGLARRWLERVGEYGAQAELHDQAATPAGMPPARFAMNQSLREAVHRLLRPPPDDLEAFPANTPDLPGDPPTPDVRLATLPAPAAAWLSRLAALGLALLASTSGRKNQAPRAVLLQALAFLPLSLLLSPVVWKAHHAALLPLLFLLLAALAAGRGRPRPLAWLLAAYLVLCTLPGQDLVGREGKALLQALSAAAWGALGLLLAALALARREPGGGSPSPRENPP